MRRNPPPSRASPSRRAPLAWSSSSRSGTRRSWRACSPKISSCLSARTWAGCASRSTRGTSSRTCLKIWRGSSSSPPQLAALPACWRFLSMYFLPKTAPSRSASAGTGLLSGAELPWTRAGFCCSGIELLHPIYLILFLIILASLRVCLLVFSRMGFQ